MTKNKINNKLKIFEEKFITKSDEDIFDSQDIKEESISSQNDQIIDVLEKEINL